MKNVGTGFGEWNSEGDDVSSEIGLDMYKKNSFVFDHLDCYEIRPVSTLAQNILIRPNWNSFVFVSEFRVLIEFGNFLIEF